MNLLLATREIIPTHPYSSIPKIQQRLPTLECTKRLKGHHGCINALSLSPDGSLMLTGSDDLRVILWRDNVQVAVHTGHLSNIFCVMFGLVKVTLGIDGVILGNVEVTLGTHFK